MSAWALLLLLIAVVALVFSAVVVNIWSAFGRAAALIAAVLLSYPFAAILVCVDAKLRRRA